MKNIFLVFLSFFLLKVSHAQLPELKIVQLNPFKKNFPEAKFLYNSAKGKVYALPLDNMPCLVAISGDPMNIASLNLKEFKKIPNAIPEQKIIPGELNENILPNISK